MSIQKHSLIDGPKRVHGEVLSYVVGFILSLILTFIPYSLVVNQNITGTALLLTILGFGVSQMVVQVVFFLHLGRGPKPRWNLYFFISTIAIVLIVVGGSVMIINNLHYNMMPSDQTKKIIGDEGIYQVGGTKTGACQGRYMNHQVTIINNQVSPFHTAAGKCDTLTFINYDKVVRQISFGPHSGHQAYAGVTQFSVRKGRNETITLSESGTYQFHDHTHEEISGDFSVSP